MRCRGIQLEIDPHTTIVTNFLKWIQLNIECIEKKGGYEEKARLFQNITILDADIYLKLPHIFSYLTIVLTFRHVVIVSMHSTGILIIL